jgi:thiol-disulfide isomerase/thioredoxin
VTAVVVAVGLVLALAGGKDDTTGPGGDAVPAYGPVTLDGAALPAFEGTADDAAAGQPAPRLQGTSPEGSAVTVGGAGQPTLVAFLAHWCPHCQRELPVLVDLMAKGELDGTRVVAVLTGTSPDRPNFPPVPWLQREGWAGDVLLDDDASTAAQGFGLSSYPYLVFLDSDGAVVARASGELPAKDIVALARQAR